MERRTSDEFDQELLNLFDQYVHGDIDRRGFLERAAKFAVGGMTAAMLLDALNPASRRRSRSPRDDKRLRTEWLDYESPQGTGKVRAYLVRPEAAVRSCRVLVVHENRGLNPHIEDIARRLALDNFVVLAPDALTPLGGYPGDEDKARERSRKLDQTQDARGLRRRRRRPEEPARVHGEDRRRGLLLRGRHREHAGDADSRPRGGRALLRYPARGRRRREDQGAAAHPLCGERRSRQFRLARLRDRAEGEQCALHDV